MAFESTSSDEVLGYSISVLKKIYKMAKKKEDTALMVAVADRLMVLYETMSDIEKSKRPNPTGFRLALGDENDREQ